MRKLLFVVCISLVLVFLFGCNASPAATTTTKPTIELTDASTILDIRSSLSGSFAQLDATAEGYSHDDLGLGDEESSVSLFSSIVPYYQIIFGYLGIYDSQSTRDYVDNAIQDEQGSITLFESKTEKLLSVAGLSHNSLAVEVSHPDIGDLSAYVEGTAGASGKNYYIKMLVIKVGRVYVFLCSSYVNTGDPSLLPLGGEIVQRIGNYSQ